jgi:hypothetical protein
VGVLKSGSPTSSLSSHRSPLAAPCPRYGGPGSGPDSPESLLPAQSTGCRTGAMRVGLSLRMAGGCALLTFVRRAAGPQSSCSGLRPPPCGRQRCVKVLHALLRWLPMSHMVDLRADRLAATSRLRNIKLSNFNDLSFSPTAPDAPQEIPNYMRGLTAPEAPPSPPPSGLWQKP